MENPILQAVKALIYRKDSKILLQQRDFTPGIIFPGYWTFFGGQVELGETLKDALKRELLEELGCVPGVIGDELFQWEWKAKPTMINYCFPLQFLVKDDMLILKEGLGMKWFSFEELHAELPLVPGIVENLDRIRIFLNHIVLGIE